MAIAAIDECVRNLVCVGGDPNRTAILDNFLLAKLRQAGEHGELGAGRGGVL